MQIPRIIHQLWKDEHVPGRWREAVASVMRYHKGWEYRLWTDALVDDYVRTKHPRFYPVFAGMNRHIMRVDVFRYVLMHDIGIVASSVLFGLLHPLGTAYVLWATAAGAGFGALYLATGSLVAPALAIPGVKGAQAIIAVGQPTAEVDTNPFSVDATRGGQILVTDAGGNDLLAVTPAGKISRLAVFPFGQTLAPPFLNQPPGTQIPYQPVPTGVATVPSTTRPLKLFTGPKKPATNGLTGRK